MRIYDVIVVGAGAAGVGVSVMLQHLGVTNMVILERHQVGASFARWPREMRFITPSFPGHGFGLLDLNAVTINTSPALTLRTEHPTGAEYAHYLQMVAQHFALPVQAGVDVHSVQPEAGGFQLESSAGTYQTRLLIWAAGEFQYPNVQPFVGAEDCIHNATVAAWQELPGEEFVVVGGYESGVDAAVHLVQLGKHVRVLDDAARWALHANDPSVALSPYTVDRLRAALATGRLELLPMGVEQVVQRNGHYELHGVMVEQGSGSGEAVRETPTILTSPTPPILATGFAGSLLTIAHLFQWHPQYHFPQLNSHDESTLTPGLFVVGPSVRHEGVIFCFIYKFRQRFAVVAKAIGEQLGLETGVLEAYRQQQMYLDDLSCCTDECVC